MRVATSLGTLHGFLSGSLETSFHPFVLHCGYLHGTNEPSVTRPLSVTAKPSGVLEYDFPIVSRSKSAEVADSANRRYLSRDLVYVQALWEVVKKRGSS